MWSPVSIYGFICLIIFEAQTRIYYLVKRRMRNMIFALKRDSLSKDLENINKNSKIWISAKKFQTYELRNLLPSAWIWETMVDIAE